ncbi:MAG: cupin domain-containing protein [Candidatus Celaenobacter polaris]|nr:cupin domain-containing protein [Candidatus Celaenobacter polaris]
MNIPAINNLFEKIPANLEEEYFEKLLKNEHFSLERIISEGQITPIGTWLCEDTNEWVILLSGSAKIQFKLSGSTLSLHPGDHFTIPAGTYHRVEWTDPNAKTVWLAMHFDSKIKD